MDEIQTIQGAAPEGRYFHYMLNMADDDLGPYEYRLLGHYRRVCGAYNHPCTESTRTTASRCKMGVGTVSQTRKWLFENGWIDLADVDGKIRVILRDRMPENVIRYSRSSPEQAPNSCSPHEQTVHPMNTVFTTRTPCSPGERSESTIKNQPPEESSLNQGHQADHDPHAPGDDDDTAWLKTELQDRFGLSPTIQAQLLKRPALELAALAIRALEKGDAPAALLITMVMREQQPTPDELARARAALAARSWDASGGDVAPTPLDALMDQAKTAATWIGLIDAWREALPVPPVGYAYSEAHRRWAEQMFDDWHITAQDVTAFVREKYDPAKSDGFWLDKSMKLQHVYQNIRAWKYGRDAAAAAREAPALPPPNPDCPTCHGQGIVLPDVPPEHALYNKPVPCPECRAIKETADGEKRNGTGARA